MKMGNTGLRSCPRTLAPRPPRQQPPDAIRAGGGDAQGVAASLVREPGAGGRVYRLGAASRKPVGAVYKTENKLPG